MQDLGRMPKPHARSYARGNQFCHSPSYIYSGNLVKNQLDKMCDIKAEMANWQDV